MSALPNELPDDHRRDVTHVAPVVGQPSGGDQSQMGIHACSVPADPPPTEASAGSDPKVPTLRWEDTELAILADSLDDLERVRIATENRVRSLLQMGGEGQPEVERMAGLVGRIETLEHGAELELKRGLRKHPFGPWVKRTLGIGEKQGARLIASIGDPYWRIDIDSETGETTHNGPRTVGQLWALCGYHVIDGVAPRRRKGVKANWNGTAKMRGFLCAEAAVKVGVRKLPGCDDTGGYDVSARKATTPLGAVYLGRRAATVDRVHVAPCAPCGGKKRPPAPIGTPWKDGHKHADALRVTAKAILRDLWLEGRRLRES